MLPVGLGSLLIQGDMCLTGFPSEIKQQINADTAAEGGGSMTLRSALIYRTFCCISLLHRSGIRACPDTAE